LLVGQVLGSVPEATPMVPLARDLERAQKRLRMKPSATEALVALDLRTESHLARSHLLHRLRLLGIGWGEQVDAGTTRGTFREAWRLVWEPELSVALIDASGYGTTIEAAAIEVVRQRVADADVASLTGLLEHALLAELPVAVGDVMLALAERSARQRDTEVLLAAIEPLARVSRYGNVRRVDTRAVLDVLRGIAVRAAIGLPSACAALDDDGAGAMRALVDRAHHGLSLVDDPDLRASWTRALATVADQRGVHGAVAGRAVRLLLDGGTIESGEAGRRLSRALSRGADAVDGAAWLEAFLSGDATLLLHDHQLLGVLDGWIGAVAPALFDDLLPLLRRTFSDFPAAERRMVADQVRRLDGSGDGRLGSGTEDDVPFDEDRARSVAPLLRAILGVEP
jgi:hypothetical protein